ncbi:YjcZ family sporulation protein [Neobacillus drentensis]
MSEGHRSSMALVIVLFVLLIIIGTSFMSGY